MLGLYVLSHPIGRVFGLWFAGAVVAALCIALPIASLNARTFYKLSHRGVATQGTVSRLEPENHRTVYYEYEVGERSYSSADQGGAGAGIPDFERLTVGDAVQVYYLPEQPSVSCLGNPHSLLANELIPLGLMIVIGPLFVIVANAARYPRFRNWLLAR